MSNEVAAEHCSALGAETHTFESFPTRAVQLGALPVARALPVREHRLVGPWCFLDRFGPLSFTDAKPMDVAPHPHIGLQTVTWMLDGEILHDDSLGCEAIARPGGVNVMTSGGGIAHAEQTPRQNTGTLSGVQLWVALPEADRHGPASFQAVERVPEIALAGGVAQVFAGSLAGVTSAARHYSPIVGAQLRIYGGSECETPLEPAFEHALLVLHGECTLEDQTIAPGHLHYLGVHRNGICLRSALGATVLLIGGPPFPERILMWWNFVARTPEEIAAAHADWEANRRFGEVRAYQGPRLSAPKLVQIARPNAVS